MTDARSSARYDDGIALARLIDGCAGSGAYLSKGRSQGLSAASPSQPPSFDETVSAPIEVRRTRAGDAELATPAQGLSLAQRRILTLLDTRATLADLARRHALDTARVERDAARLRLAGLIEDVAPAAPAVDAAAPVRLGAPLSRRVPLALVPLVAGALAWAAWQHLATPAGTDSPRARRADAPAAEGKVSAPAAPEPVPIATRVLRGSTPERPHEPGKDARTTGKPTEPATPPIGETVATRKAAAPVPETASVVTPASVSPTAPTARAPAADATPPAPRVGVKPAPDAKGASDANPIPKPEPAAQPETHPEPARATSPAPSAEAHTVPPAEPAPAGPDARLAPMPPLQLASIAPVTVSLRAPAPAKLTPIARETPAFPREAIAQGLASGSVKARITVDARGRVAGVDILETSHRAFERAVRETLAAWQFEPGASGRTTTVDFAFKRD
jgi:TonB family protein